jgi:cell division protein FtsB
MTALAVAIAVLMPVPHDASFLATQADWTLFADVFGSVGGTIFSGLAFAGLIWTIRIQQQELKETREELAKTATAQVESQKAHEAHVRVAQQSARLSAATALLSHYDGQMYRLAETIEVSLNEKKANQTADLERMSVKRTEVRKEIYALRDELRDLVRYAEVVSETLPQETAGTVTVKNP